MSGTLLWKFHGVGCVGSENKCSPYTCLQTYLQNRGWHHYHIKLPGGWLFSVHGLNEIKISP